MSTGTMSDEPIDAVLDRFADAGTPIWEKVDPRSLRECPQCEELREKSYRYREALNTIKFFAGHLEDARAIARQALEDVK